MKEEIKKFFKGDVSDDKETVLKYSHDASLFEIAPKVVLYPKDSEDVKNLVKWVSENKSRYPNLSITARSAGTDMTGGPLNDSIILDFTRYMNKLVSFNSQQEDSLGPRVAASLRSSKNDDKRDLLNQTLENLPVANITVQPGMFYRDFEKITLETRLPDGQEGLILPSYPASKSICAMGGMFSNNSGGEKTLRYGKTEDYIASAKVVFSDGNEYEIKPLSKSELKNKTKQKDKEGKI